MKFPIRRIEAIEKMHFLERISEVLPTAIMVCFRIPHAGAAQRLLYEYLHPDLPNLPPVRRKFRANRSMRDVESSVELTVKNLNDWTPRP